MVVKAERSKKDCIWLNPKYNKMGNQQPRSEQDKVQRLSKAIGLETQMKIREQFKFYEASRVVPSGEQIYEISIL